MNRSTERKLHTALTAVIGKWLDEQDGDDMPYLGDNTKHIMADAALAVLIGIDDSQVVLRADGMLKEE